MGVTFDLLQTHLVPGAIQILFWIPKGRGFKIASLNITSLLKHLDELRILLNYDCIDLLAINEQE